MLSLTSYQRKVRRIENQENLVSQDDLKRGLRNRYGPSLRNHGWVQILRETDEAKKNLLKLQKWVVFNHKTKRSVSIEGENTETVTEKNRQNERIKKLIGKTLDDRCHGPICKDCPRKNRRSLAKRYFRSVWLKRDDADKGGKKRFN